ncbi:MAG: putative Ig domain-containing protein [Candidatus Acidiferrum sp.]
MIIRDTRRAAQRFNLWILFAIFISLFSTSQIFAQHHSFRDPSSDPTPLKISSSPLPTGEVGIRYSAQLTATGGTPPYTWSVRSGSLPTGLSLNSSTGLISGTPTVAITSDVVSFHVKDSSDPSERKSISLSLSIDPSTSAVAPVTISTTALPAATVNVAYSQQLAAAGGSGNFTWSLTTAVAGFSLSSTGLLAGTPTSTTALSFQVKATDALEASVSATATLKLTVNSAAATPVSITTTTLPAATANAAYSQQLSATGGSGSYTWSLTTAVSGFSLSTSGLLAGTSTSATTLSFAVKVVDTNNTSNSATATLKVTVNAAAATPVSITTTTLPAATKGIAYSQQLSATGGSGGYTWTLTTAVTGFSLSSSGLLTGTPTSTTALSFAVKVADSANSSSSATATLSLTVNATGTGSTYYVSPSGSDSNPGTQLSPWKTIQHAADSVQAGDTVYVMAGTYNESITIAVSGSAAAGSVTFASYPGQTAIVDGTGLSVSGDNTQGLFNIEDESYVTIQGFTIENYTTSSANATPAGIWVTGSGSYINILNNTVTNITTSSEKNGNAFGIAVYGSEAPAAISYITISGNTVYNNKTGNSETVNVDGNVTNFVISNNLIHDNDNIGIDAIGFEGVSPDSAYDYARNGEISGNTVYNITAINNPGEGNEYDADGIYCDGCASVVIERNLSYQNDLNIEVASEHSGHYSTGVTVRNNVVYAANSVGISIGGYASNVGGTQNCTIVNNTLYGDDTKNTGSGEFQVQYYATNNIFENNIVYATSQGLFINSYTNSESDPVTANYNLYYSSVSATSANFLWNGSNYTGFSSYQSGSGQDSHSQYANPLFVSLGTPPNLQVQSTSPAINAGTDLSSTIVGTLDYAGDARVQGTSIDIGAYEH